MANNTKRRALWAARLRCDVFVVGAAAAALPGLAMLLVYANRFLPVHMLPVVAAAIPFFARSWKAAIALRFVSGALFVVVFLLGAASIGVLFAPSAGLAVAGAVAAIRAADRASRAR